MASLIIAAAGSGTRFNEKYNKLLYVLDGKTIIQRTIEKFIEFDYFKEIIIVLKVSEIEEFRKIPLLNNQKIKFVIGGKTRQESVKNGVQNAQYEYVFVHDGARCNISRKLIEKIIKEVKVSKLDAYVVAINSKDTTHIVENNIVTKVLDRNQLFNMQTPQIAKKEILMKSYNDKEFTDEVGVLFNANVEVNIINGEDSNIKITTKHDLGAINE